MRLRPALLLALLLAGCSGASRATPDLPPLRTVEHVYLDRYLGTWFEIASFPQRFQKGCTATQANYSLRPDGDITVRNRCNKGGLNGPESSVEGKARVVDKVTNAKLEVSFFWPFWGDYWVIDLGPNYEFAVVGHPSRDYLWILSRTPTLSAATYDAILARIGAQGYDLSRLHRTLQVKSE
jgi:apolipoprotein D and lipocalin family protein